MTHVDVPHRLRELGLELPALRQKAGNYLGCRAVGELLFLAVQGADGWVVRVSGAFRSPGVAEGRRIVGW